MRELVRRKHATERSDTTPEDTETHAQQLEQPTSEATTTVGSADVRLIVGPPGCCGTSELPVRKQPQRA